MKKVLFVCNRQNTSNPFVSTLVEGLNANGCYAEIDNSKFWTDDKYDIYHFQWPESIFDWKKSIKVAQYESLKKRLLYLKQNGKKIVITCHNLKPHVIKDSFVNSLYTLIYGYCDLFIHLGSYSKTELENIYPNAKHVIVPHHIYDSLYSFNLNKSKCQDELHINSNFFNILCFGEFRNDEERNLIIRLSDKLKNTNYRFIVPGFYRKHWYSKSPIETIKRILKIIKYKSLGFRFLSNSLSDFDTEKYFTACDVVLIQRLKILNSGNLPMGFFAGKVIVGPNIGNIGSILNETGNSSFDPSNFDSILSSIERAKILSENGIGNANKKYALDNWSTQVVCKRIILLYENL